MISSINGAVLDTFALTKPAGFKPDLAGRTAFLSSFKQTYFPGQNYPASIGYLEQTGAQAVLVQQRQDSSPETVSTVLESRPCLLHHTIWCQIPCFLSHLSTHGKARD